LFTASNQCIEQLQNELKSSKERIRELEKKLDKEKKSKNDEDDEDNKDDKDDEDDVVIVEKSKTSKTADDSERTSNNDDHTPQSTHTVATHNKMYILEAMTCIDVIIDEHGDYICTIIDGQLNGHEFKLQLDKHLWEYTYTPTEPASCLKPDNDLCGIFYFPDHMLPRFVTKLHNATYSD
jgi:hypothetical protein